MSQTYKYAVVRIFPSFDESDRRNNPNSNDLFGLLIGRLLEAIWLALKGLYLLFRIVVFKERYNFRQMHDDYFKAKERRRLPTINYEIVGETPRIEVSSESEIIAKLGAEGYIIYDRKDESRVLANNWVHTNKAIFLRKQI